MPSLPSASSLETLDASSPVGRILSNGIHLVLLTSAGTGVSASGGCRWNVWSGDRVEDREGFFIYLRDSKDGHVWSAGLQPVASPPESYRARWRPGILAIDRTDAEIRSHVEVCVPPGEDAELRRVTLTNLGSRSRRIELTSFIEVVLAPPAAYAAHPAFSKLFVQTGSAPGERAVVARRRPRSPDESNPCLIHSVLEPCAIESETDRARFLGRYRDVRSPRAIHSGVPLPGTIGNVLDPIMSLRRRIELAPGGSISTTFLLAAAGDVALARAVASRLADEGAIDRAFAGAEAHTRDRIREAGLSATEAEYAEDLAAAIFYGDPALRAGSEVLESAMDPRQDLRALGLSRERPYVVLHAESDAGARLLPDLLVVHRYWRALGLPIDLLVLDGETPDRGTLESETSPSLDLAHLRCSAASLSQATLDRLDAAASMVVRNALPDRSGSPARTRP